MTVHGLYCLTLYCENVEHHEEGHKFMYDSGLMPECGIPGGRGEFVGRNRTVCIHDARKEGWVFDSEIMIAFCPHCVENGLTKKEGYHKCFNCDEIITEKRSRCHSPECAHHS